MFDIFFNKVGQTLHGLTLTKSYMQTKKKQREYNLLKWLYNSLLVDDMDILPTRLTYNLLEMP